ncbi:hypothetical protein JOC54_000732 [Alkalihalobacillus xiaoxiensis]|uniref:Small peptidoglycan-associated lipoprotein n=1 Tax=Shouchella xiaoxiensis TaxID=766895 RepID=A0ABS2SPP9_9BACI|nr:hypothetical protein [Shouchella xiaoxiensis]MBM7837501.1 hypothetical protein [Shouchella xiaoxiensis]
MVQKKVIFLIASVLCISLWLNGCTYLSSALSSPKLHSEEADTSVTLLFSDPNELKNEKTYYDALYAVQNKHGHTITELIISESTNRQAIEYYSIETFPTMVIYQGEEELIRFSGEQEQAFLQTQLEAFFGN